MTSSQTALSLRAAWDTDTSHYEIHWAYQCSWICQPAYSMGVWIQSGNLSRKVSHIPFTNPVLLSCFLQKQAHWWSLGKKRLMQHMTAPHTSKHMWTGLVSKLGWFFFVCVVILGLGLFCCLGFLLLLLLFICFTFLTWKETWSGKITEDVLKNIYINNNTYA